MRHLLNLPAVEDLFALLGPDQVRLVGGCVRDALLDTPAKDIDACTPMEPNEVIRMGEASAQFSVHPTGLAHGTVTLFHRPTKMGIEVTTLRRDVSTDGRHATVAFSQDWREDAARRDFTFNALMLDQAGQVHDNFGGQEDLAAGRVRFIGSAKERLAEDWLRALRYFRFWGRFGQERPSPKEREALSQAADHMHRLSVERIWVELKGLIQTANSGAALALFQDLGFARALDLQLNLRPLPKLDPVAAWFGVLLTGGSAFLDRMKASTQEKDHFDRIALAYSSQAPAFERQVRFGHGATQIAERLKGSQVLLTPPPEFPIQGRDLIAYGMAPGPKMGQTLDSLMDRWIAAEGQMSRADLLEDLTKS